jgi:hypothetical protein
MEFHATLCRHPADRPPAAFIALTYNNNNNNNTIEIQRMWNVKTRAIPVIIGGTESFQNHSENT